MGKIHKNTVCVYELYGPVLMKPTCENWVGWFRLRDENEKSHFLECWSWSGFSEEDFWQSILTRELTLKNRESTLIILLQDSSLSISIFFNKNYVKRWEHKWIISLPKRDKDERETGRDIYIAHLHNYWAAIIVHSDKIEQLHDIIRQQWH